ncbi:MAG: glutathione S-transferase family protein [Betaproteobacteria bacterium]
MKLYMHPVSMTSRPVRLFIAEHNIQVEEQTVDLMTGEHYKEPFTAVNPSRQVPVLNTQFYREYGYGFIYPQIFPNNERPTDAAQQACLDWSKERAQNWLKVLNDHWIGKDRYLCGNDITIADYLGAAFVSLGEIIGIDFGKYPNIKRWLDNMKKLESWPKVNEVFYGFAGAVKDQKFVTL